MSRRLRPGAGARRSTRPHGALACVVAAVLAAGGAGDARAQAPAVSRARDPRPGVPVGRVTEHTIPSATYGHPRRVWVYTPPGYDPRAPRAYPLVVAFDGADYLDTIPLPLVLDTLLAAHAAPPFVAVLVDDADRAIRLRDLANQPSFARFLADELVPWVRRGWHVTTDPARTIVTGSSAGGLAAAFVAFERPDIFGNVLSQSGAFWRGPAGAGGAPYEWLTTRYARAPRKPIRLRLEVGALETRPAGGTGPSILEANRHLRAVLHTRGYDLSYVEVPDGVHAPITWRVRLPVALRALVGGWAAR